MVKGEIVHKMRLSIVAHMSHPIAYDTFLLAVAAIPSFDVRLKHNV